jgi:hypothetical protein
MTVPPKTLRIRESATPGVYRFLIDGVDISDRIDRAEMIMYYGRREDEQKQTRLILAARMKLPERYQMTVYKGKRNGRRE